MEENDFYKFLKILQKYKLCYQFKQRLKKSIKEYQNNGYRHTYTSLFARAFIQNKKLWVREMKTILLDEYGMRLSNREVIENIIFLMLDMPIKHNQTAHMLINEIDCAIKNYE